MSSAALTSFIVLCRDSNIFPESFLEALMNALENLTFIHPTTFHGTHGFSCIVICISSRYCDKVAVKDKSRS